MRKDKLAVCHVRSTPQTDVHGTPKAFFNYIQNKFNIKFTIDVAATKDNSLCRNYITKKDNALKQTWQGTAWCNPPYSLTREFVEHCHQLAEDGHATTFLLLAARTDRDWWHNHAKTASYIVFIKGRLKFAGAKAGAPFPSILLVFKKNNKRDTKNIYLSPTPYERGFQRGKPT